MDEEKPVWFREPPENWKGVMAIVFGLLIGLPILFYILCDPRYCCIAFNITLMLLLLLIASLNRNGDPSD